jgi:hypothetical protein
VIEEEWSHVYRFVERQPGEHANCLRLAGVRLRFSPRVERQCLFGDAENTPQSRITGDATLELRLDIFENVAAEQRLAVRIDDCPHLDLVIGQ